jgi:hypothetical protein
MFTAHPASEGVPTAEHIDHPVLTVCNLLGTEFLQLRTDVALYGE